MTLATDEILQHAVFRALLQAMSRPGSVQPLPAAARQEPLLELLDAVCDPEVSFCLARADAALEERIVRRCGARPAPAESADFLVAPAGTSHGRLEELRRGTPDYPDRGATVIYQVASFAPGGVAPLLSGPGIKETVRPSLCGLDPAELAALRRSNAEFPLGVDAVLVSAGGEVLCIPRSTSIGD